MTPADTPLDPFAKAVMQLVTKQPPTAAITVYSTQGIKLIEKGSVVSPGLYERITQHSLSVPLQDSLQAQGSVTGKSLRATAELLFSQMPILARLIDKPAMQSLLLQALETLPLPAPIVFQLTVARDVQAGLYRHLVCTALVAGWLASGQTTSRVDISMLVTAGLLHDLGMLHVDPILLTPDAPLSREQRRQLYSHPLVSELLLQRHPEYSRELVRAVREHHEMLDGSGYPAGLTSSKISPWGRILSVSQVVSALIRPERPLGALRLSLLLRTNRHHFDPVLGQRVLAVLQLVLQADVSSQALLSPVSDESTEEAALQAASNPVVNPLERLICIDMVLTAWPGEFARNSDFAQVRRDGMALIGEQCVHMRRIFAETGATVAQLTLLSSLPSDDALNTELSLITRELAWQMRTLIRRVRRKWALAADEAYPEVLQSWLTQAEEACRDLINA